MASLVRWQYSHLESRGEGGVVTFNDLQRRQNGNSTQPPPNNNNNNNNNQGAPLSVFTFIIAIALFVLVVSFVLLRIFVRNRRLRRLGIYPESPIERLLGGAPREYEDTLVPPRLWHANIADVQAHNAGAQSRAEKSVLGGNVGAGDTKEHGWDALMPVAAALPPSLYPIIYQADAAAAAANANANSTNAPNASSNDEQGAIFSRIAPLRPDFWRRSTAEAVTTGNVQSNDVEAQNGATSATQATAGEKTGQSTGAGVPAVDRPDRNEKVAASVNITVLISMPSHKTIFPSTKKLNVSTSNLRKSSSKVNSSGTFGGTQSKLAEVDEGEDPDTQSFKGKARRTPSLRSIRTTASTKTQGEARREAFFAQTAGQDVVEGGAAPNATLPTAEPMTYADDEDEELPELVFGTASVPLYSKIVPPSAALGSRALGGVAPSSPTLVSPSCDEIMALVAAATQARTSKPAARPAKKTSSGGDADADAERVTLPRRSVAGTSMEGGLSAAEEQAGLGDVVSRMMRPNNNGGAAEAEAYELGDLSRPSFTSMPSSSFVRDATPTPTAANGAQLTSPSSQGLIQGAAGIATLGTPLHEKVSSHAPVAVATSQATDSEGPVPAISSSSMYTARSGDRQSTSTWHTGDDADGVAHVAALTVDLDDHDNDTQRRPTTSS